MLECVYGGDTGMKKTRTGTDPWAPKSKKPRSFSISEQQDWRVPIYSHFSSLCCYFALLLMVFLNDVIGFCSSLHLFCLTFLCFCLRLSSNREQSPGSFLQAQPNVFLYKQLMWGVLQESISVSKRTLHAKKLQATDVYLQMWHYLTKLHPSGVMNALLGHIRLI